MKNKYNYIQSKQLTSYAIDKLIIQIPAVHVVLILIHAILIHATEPAAR